MTNERLKLIEATTNLSQPDLRKDLNVYDIALFKQMILKDMYKDKDIIEVLHNPVLEEQGAAPEDYRNVNIFTYLKIPDTQSTVKNFICFDINDVGEIYGSAINLDMNVVFRTTCHEDDVDTDYGIDRQDLLAMLIKDRYSWSNYLGMSLQPEYDTGKVAEKSCYYYREIRFKIVAPNALNQKGTYIRRFDKDRGIYG